MTDNNNTGSVRITNKQIYEGLNEVNKTLALNNQKMDLHIQHVDKKLGDHETRIRKVEESMWRSSWLTSVITAVITAIAVGLTLTMMGI